MTRSTINNETIGNDQHGAKARNLWHKLWSKWGGLFLSNFSFEDAGTRNFNSEGPVGVVAENTRLLQLRFNGTTDLTVEIN